MGGIFGLCTPGGGPCGGNIDSEQRGTKRHADMERQKLLQNDASDTPNGDSMSIDETISKDSKSIQTIQTISKHNKLNKNPSFDTSKSSIFNVPTKKIVISPLIAKHILTNHHFISIRKRMEANALKSPDIDKILFQKHYWLIQGSDSIALEEHRDLFDIIIWRVPIIPAFAHFNTPQQLYTKLFENEENFEKYSQGIWSLLAKENFIEMFDRKLLDEIDIINDKKHSYLADAHTFASNSEAYKDLIDKLDTIEVMKKANEIVMIGQKMCVIDLLRIIRQAEVNHGSMAGMFNTKSRLFEWEIKSDDGDAPDPKYIRSYYCVIGNIGVQCTEDDLQELLVVYPRWIYAGIIDCEDVNDGDSDEKHSDEGGKSAKIEFDSNEALEKFISDIEGNDGLYLNENKLCVEEKDKQLKKRKRRRLYAGQMIV